MSKRSEKTAVNQSTSSFLEELESRQFGDTVAELRYYLRREKSSVHFFLEGGTDKLFYTDQITKLRPDVKDYEIYECGGREAVLDMYRKFSCDPGSLMFVVDRDAGIDREYEISDKIFITDSYSFENYFITKNVFVGFCQGHLGLTSASDRTPFINLYDTFIATAIPVGLRATTFVIAMRQSGLRVEFDDYPATRIATVTDQFRLILTDFGRQKAGEIARKLGDTRACRNGWRAAKASGYGGMVRGKYILAWFGLFLRKVVETARSGELKVKHHVVSLVDYGVPGLIAALKNSVEPSARFEDFLAHNVPSQTRSLQ